VRWRRVAMLAPVIVSVLLVGACSPVVPFMPEPSQVPHGQGRLWQVDGDGIETSYVFASFYRPDKRVLSLPPAAEAALEKSETMALQGTEDPYIVAEIYTEENLEMPGGETLEGLIGARSYGILTWHMKQHQRAPNDKIKPWVMWIYMGGLNFGYADFDDSVDHRAYQTQEAWLEERAFGAGKRIVELEGEQEYFEIFDKIPLEQQVDMLKVVLDRYEGLPPQVHKTQLYLDGDLATLDAVWRDYLGWLQPATAETLDDRVINDRNPVMVERMLPLMQEHPTFVAVDYSHLPGEQGVLRLLERRGLTIRPLF